MDMSSVDAALEDAAAEEVDTPGALLLGAGDGPAQMDEEEPTPQEFEALDGRMCSRSTVTCCSVD